jgi:hypothetical protein
MRCPGGLNENQAAESTLSWLLSLLPLYDLTPGDKQTGDNEDHEGGQLAAEVSEESAREPVTGRSGLHRETARRELEEYFDDDRSHQKTADCDARAD